MEDFFSRIVENLAGRVSGPMKLRLIFQPTMAAIFAIRSGLKDARTGKPPYLWGMIKYPEARAEMLKDGWKSVGKVFIVALVLDAVYQLKVLHTVHPGGALLMSLLLAIVPYVILRGLVTRVARKK